MIIAGKSGDTSAVCKQLVRESKNRHKIDLFFDVSDKEIEALYKNAMAFVYPSLYEGFGIPVIDAMQYALPIITSQNSSMSEIVGSIGHYFDANNTESIASQLELLDKNQLTKPDKAQVQKQMELLSTDVQNHKLNQLYTQLL